MNRYAKAIVMQFKSRDNEIFLANQLVRYFNSEKVYKFVNANIASMVINFSKRIEHELSLSDPMPGITLQDQVICYNSQFLADRCNFIKQHVVCREEVAKYTVTDDMPTSRHGLKHHTMSADDMLESWKSNAARGVQLREDPQGDAYIIRPEVPISGQYTFDTGDSSTVGGHTKSGQTSGPREGFSTANITFNIPNELSRVVKGSNAKCGVNSVATTSSVATAGDTNGASSTVQTTVYGKPRQYNPFSGQGDNKLATGITFCDQSALGTSNHLEQFLSNSYIQGLNATQPGMAHANSAIGNATPEGDARLLERRIFRNNEQGIENGIPVYQQRLHRRYLERDVSEGLRAGERDCLVSGYDMSDLYARVDYKRSTKAQFEPTCTDRNRVQLQNNTPQFTTEHGITTQSYDGYPLSEDDSDPHRRLNMYTKDSSGNYIQKSYIGKTQNDVLSAGHNQYGSFIPSDKYGMRNLEQSREHEARYISNSANFNTGYPYGCNSQSKLPMPHTSTPFTGHNISYK